MIGRRYTGGRSVSGEGGSCFYRAVAFQLTEQEHRPYLDSYEVRGLRARTRSFLELHARDRIPSDRDLTWRDVGGYVDGYAEAPIPQAMAYVIGQPVTVHVGGARMRYGKELPGKGVQVKLTGQHYSIMYDT